MKKLLLFLLFIGAATSCFARIDKATIKVTNKTDLNRGWKFMIESEGKPLFKGFKYLKIKGSSKSVTVGVPVSGKRSFTVQILSFNKLKKLGDNRLSASDRVSFVIKIAKPAPNMEFVIGQKGKYGPKPSYNDVMNNTDVTGGDASCTVTKVK